MSYEPPFVRTAKIDALCMEIAELVGMLSPETPLAKSPKLHRELRIKTIHSSLLIEGNKLDENAVTAIIDGKHVLGDSRDILEVENARRAYDLIPILDPYSIDDLLKAHRTMMEGLVSEAGRFRSSNVGVFDGDVLIHAGTPATYVPDVMCDIFEWLKTTSLHPLLASCIFHFEFEFCHPFADGNGRTGRLWHTLLLSRWRPVLAWLPVERVIRQRQSEYYTMLAKSEAIGSSEPFVEFILEAIRDAALPFAKPGSERSLTKARTLAFFVEHPNGNITQLAEHLGCSKRSAERIVAELKDEGAIERKGSSRAGVWIVLQDVEKRTGERKSYFSTERTDWYK
ncbi:Fic family protein [Adlercreutzia sp. ZJ304]|uniref:Fic family protein n=1 Tax=Adlercreutzia sp. ZJ304 TaxID=2709791 RepID=UPI0013EE0EFA|nr:Fic family protein [Adlercreutzia sp. ZJ304]